MEKEVYKTKYVVCLFNEETEILSLKYFKETEYMTDEEFLEFTKDLIVCLYQYKPKFFIDDNSERLYASTPEMQAWGLNKVIPVLNEIGLKKYIKILPQDFIGKLSADQIRKMANTKFSTFFETNSTDDYDEAIRWIKE